MTKEDFESFAFVMFNAAEDTYGVQIKDLDGIWRTEHARTLAQHILAECDRADRTNVGDFFRRLDEATK